ncbi:unnamed protein product [Ilex paraguariensis]|uniref:Post-SET domain-containing protein n=1 Tax=Ilex paraguariensis TaxID=185542 RepID=A0ABC8UDQ3_9AQUA
MLTAQSLTRWMNDGWSSSEITVVEWLELVGEEAGSRCLVEEERSQSFARRTESVCSMCKQSRDGDETKILPITTVSMVNLTKTTETIALRRLVSWVHNDDPHDFRSEKPKAVVRANNYGVCPTSIWALAAGNQFSSLSYGNQADQLLTASKGWQNGDWICTCGFHKCSPRAQNIDMNSLGSWEDGANGWSETLSEPSMSQKKIH